MLSFFSTDGSGIPKTINNNIILSHKYTGAKTSNSNTNLNRDSSAVILSKPINKNHTIISEPRYNRYKFNKFPYLRMTESLSNTAIRNGKFNRNQKAKNPTIIKGYSGHGISSINNNINSDNYPSTLNINTNEGGVMTVCGEFNVFVDPVTNYGEFEFYAGHALAPAQDDGSWVVEYGIPRIPKNNNLSTRNAIIGNTYDALYIYLSPERTIPNATFTIEYNEGYIPQLDDLGQSFIGSFSPGNQGALSLPGWYHLFKYGGNDVTMDNPPTIRITVNGDINRLTFVLCRVKGNIAHLHNFVNINYNI